MAKRAAGLNFLKPKFQYAYVTLIGSAEYISAAVVLSQSLRFTGTVHDLVLLLDDDANLNSKDPILSLHFDKIMRAKTVRNRYNIKGFNKLNAWLLEQYEKVLYIDVDTIVLYNLDHLFEHPEISAVPDVYFSEKFNSGLLVIKPSKVS